MIASRDALAARVRAAALDAIERHHLPGLSIGVVQGDALILSESFGHAEIESRTPMQPQHRQCIASITKTMVGLCAMALADEGKLTLDARVADLLPDVRFHGPAETMTVRHLLTHSAGIGEAQTQELLASTISPDADARRKPGTFASMYAEGCVVEYEPGTKWHYANHGYNFLGEIISRAEGGGDLHDVMQRRIFGPLGMANTDLLGADDPSLATPYHRAPSDDTREQLTRAGLPVPDEATVDGHNIRGAFGGEFNRAAMAAGGVQSNLPDMARYASALLRRGHGIVRPETFDAMVRPQYCPDSRLVSWGLAFARTPFPGRTLIGHGGAYFGGWNSDLALSLDEDIAVIQHMNVMVDDPAPAFRQVQRAVFDVAEPPYTPRAVDPAVLDDALGAYRLTPGRLTNFRPATRIGPIHVERDGNGLKLTSRWGKWKSGVQLIPADEEDPWFFAVQPDGRDRPHIAFTRGPDGCIDGLRCDQLVRMVKVQE